MRLVAEPAGRIEAGEILYKGRDLLKLSEAEMRHVRGREIAMVFQADVAQPGAVDRPPAHRGLEIHMNMAPAQARARAVELPRHGGHPGPGAPARAVSASLQRRHAPAR